MGVKLDHVRDLHGDPASPMKWPNSAAVFNDGRIAVADSGHNRATVLTPDGDMIWQGGQQGFSTGDLREPIYVFVTPDQYLLVSDWHNHRFCVYRPDLSVSHVLGHLGRLSPVRGVRDGVRLCLSFLSNLAIEYVGAPYYFTPSKMKNGRPEKPKRSLKMLIWGMWHYARNWPELKAIFTDTRTAMMKPNGAVFRDGHLIVAQKGHQCLSEYKVVNDWRDLDLVRHVKDFNGGDTFLRLCNMSQDPQDRIYVCDQKRWRIVVFDKDLNYHSEITFADDGRYPDGPFSCAVLNADYIAVAIGFKVEVRALDGGQVVAELDGFGETHGITWDEARQYLYFVDRSESCLRQIKVTFGEER